MIKWFIQTWVIKCSDKQDMKTLTNILIPAICLLIFAGYTWPEINKGNTEMNQQIYTLGAWHVQDGKQQEFIQAWKELGETFSSLEKPPTGKGVLIQSTSDSALFYSFGPWDSLEDIEEMRNNERARAGIQKLVDLCTTATPGSFQVVAESP
jgi:heme-degrading monooxygenase HmoA